MARVNQVQIDEAIANFQYEGILVEERPYGNGHINDTFLLTFEIRDGTDQSDSPENEQGSFHQSGRTHGKCHRGDILPS